jgi:hypothetical protein
MGKDYSTLSAARAIAQKINELGIVPPQRGWGGCGV